MIKKKLKNEYNDECNERIVKKLKHDINEIIVNQICQRCKTHPDDVNWIEGNDCYESLFSCLLSIRNGEHDSSVIKACTGLVESDSFRIFDEIRYSYGSKDASLLLKNTIKKLIVLKPSDVMDMFQKYDMNDGVAKEISSFLYGKKEQSALLSKFNFYNKYHACHLIDDWVSLDTQVLSDRRIVSSIMNKDTIGHCTKECCVLAVFRNYNMSLEILAVRASYCFFMDEFIIGSLSNKCVCMNDDLIKLFLQILDRTIEKNREYLFHTIYRGSGGNTLLHRMAIYLKFPGDGCCIDKWLSLLSKIINRFPNDVLSRRSFSYAGFTPYDIIQRIRKDKGYDAGYDYAFEQAAK